VENDNPVSQIVNSKQASHAMATDLGVEPIFVQTGDTIFYDPSYVITRDVSGDNLGIYFQKVYAK
jgi:hypothetical protein